MSPTKKLGQRGPFAEVSIPGLTPDCGGELEIKAPGEPRHPVLKKNGQAHPWPGPAPRGLMVLGGGGRVVVVTIG